MSEHRFEKLPPLHGPDVPPADPVAEGLRLVKAFMQISDPAVRERLLELAERTARGAPRPPKSSDSCD